MFFSDVSFIFVHYCNYNLNPGRGIKYSNSLSFPCVHIEEAVHTAGLVSSEVCEASPSTGPVCSDPHPSVLNSIVRPMKLFPFEAFRSGQGEVSGERCMQYLFTIACPGNQQGLNSLDLQHAEETRFDVHKCCCKLTCPKCFPAVASRMAKRITVRMQKLAVLYSKAGVKLGRRKHMSWSLPPDRYSLEYFLADGGKAYMDEIEALQADAAKDGFFAGANVLHLHRQKHVDDHTECRKPYCKREHVWEFSPHVHFSGYGYFEDSEAFQERTGCVYHIAPDHGPRDFFTTLRYNFTHSVQFVKSSSGRAKKGYRYVGLFSERRYRRVRKERRKVAVPCEVHKDIDKHKYAPTIEGKPDPHFDCDQGVYHRTEVIEEWELSPRHKQTKVVK